MENQAESSFRTLKIVGVSGVGKTTLIRAYMANFPQVQHLCFSEFLAKYGHRASEQMETSLHASRGLVLMDEHLEIGDDDLIELYRREHTVGIFVIEAPPSSVLWRRKKDIARTRCLNKQTIESDQDRSRSRAILLAVQLSIPAVIVKGGSPKDVLAALISFTESLGLV